MELNKTLKNLISQKAHINIEGVLNSEIIFTFKEKIICSINKNSKDFFNQDDHFTISFFNEAFEKFYSKEYLMSIVFSDKKMKFSTNSNTENYECCNIDLCSELYKILIIDLFDTEELLTSFIGKIKNKTLSKIQNIKPLIFLKKLNESPEKISCINLSDNKIFFEYKNYLLSIFKLHNEYILRLFLDKDYNHNDYSKLKKQSEYIEPFYIDFTSSSYYSENTKFFESFYTTISERVIDHNKINSIINNQ